MKSANVAVGTGLCLLSIHPSVSRPLSNPVVLGLFGGDTPSWQTLLLVAVGVSALLFFLVRLGSRQHKDASDSDISDGEWNAAPQATVSRDTPDDRQRPSQDRERPETSPQNQPDDADGDPEEYLREPPEGTVPEFLAGQGGAREKGFEVEQRPPDASLSDHLEHLRAELDDPDSQRELDRLEALVEETEDDTEIPPRCPQEHCPAVWSERRIIGREGGRYERLDDDRIICLECETVHTLE